MADEKIRPAGAAPAADPQAQQKCPACGGTTRFDPVKGALVCEYCGTVTPIPTEKKEEKKEDKQGEEGAESVSMQGFDFKSLNDQATDLNAENLPVYSCVSCGAEVIAPAEQIALTCPYCRNNIVLTDKVSGKLRPDAGIPFRITTKELPAAMNRFYKGKVLLPKRFFSDSTMGNVTGVYVPFWIFSGKIGGRMIYNAHTTSTARRGNYEDTTTSRYSLERDVSMEFKNVPVDASGKIKDELMDSLEPFDMNDAKPFDMRYLAGFTADRFDEAKSDIAARAEKRMYTTAANVAAASAGAGFSGVTHRGGKLKLDMDAKYMLLPVYLFDLTFDGKKYSFAVNGQTGKVVGEIPTDSKVSLQYFLVRTLGVLAAILGAFIIKYLTGG